MALPNQTGFPALASLLVDLYKGSGSCVFTTMPFSNTRKKVRLNFNNIIQLNAFKNGSDCRDFYIDRDAFMLVGSFTEEQLQIANDKYAASYKIISD